MSGQAVDGSPRFQPPHCKGNARNEALDLMTMTNVMAFLFGLPRMPWESPPGWAATWDVNTMVVSMEEETAARNATALAA
ncbi:hypothetical protein [Komagataeibacter diospyri]|uniref:hypothetical protein n=1 Tax=Komagataeibacter diospyri TaxID=1932662 RepID=UPI0037566750